MVVIWLNKSEMLRELSSFVNICEVSLIWLMDGGGECSEQEAVLRVCCPERGDVTSGLQLAARQE